MEKSFVVKISKDQLAAQLELVQEIGDDFSITVSELEDLLRDEKIVFGIEHETLKDLSENPQSFQFPLTIAKGIPPKNGEDAYITVEVYEEKSKKREKINFRDVLDIPSVKNGQVIANIVQQTFGSEGTSVTGRRIPARNGKPLKTRAGKNVVQIGNQFIATIDGQVSITDRTVTVNPVYEVRGDLDLKTGNIHFIGNVVIHGNVPTGYEVTSGGDIKVYGLVEGAHLHAKGNIYISGGVTGGYKGSLVADGSIQATYLNQADVKASEDIIIHSSILHSKVVAGGSVVCERGRIIGGCISSGKDIKVKELGNRLYTKTEITIGFDPALDEREKIIKEELEKNAESLKKLNALEHKLIESARLKGQVSEQEKNLILKQRATKNQLIAESNDLNRQLLEIEEERYEKQCGAVYVYDIAYPNVIFHFGKYSKSINREHSFVRFFVSGGEISFDPIG
jgi:uncharacterized protein (DUF342 family)